MIKFEITGETELWTYKDNLFALVDKTIRIKNTTTREWENGVLFMNSNGKFYVRNRQDFENKFKFVGTSTKRVNHV